MSGRESGPAVTAEPSPGAPPEARRLPHVRELHGDRFEDPWFWLRERDDPAVVAHLEAENAWAERVMAPARELREELYAELVSRVKEEDESVPYPRGGWRYFWRIGQGQQHRVHLRRRGEDGPEQVLVDLNDLGRELKYVALGELEISDDGARMAVTLDRVGFREYTLEIEDLADRRAIDVPIPKVTSVAWAADGRSLYYTVEDAAKRSYRALVHRLGTPVESDAVIFEERDERFRVEVRRSRSGEWIFLTSASHTTSEVRRIDARATEPAAVVVEPRRQDHIYELDHWGDRFFVRSNRDGRHFAIFSAPVGSPGEASWRPIVAHDPAVMIERLDAFAGHFVTSERVAGLPRFRVFDLDGGGARTIELPEAAYSATAGPNEEPVTGVFRYHYESPVTPPSVYEYRLGEGRSVLLKRDEVPGYDATRYEVERIAATAPDGVEVPMTVVSPRGLPRGGGARALLKGYGSYGFPYPVTFDRNVVSLLERGFVVAIAHVRGGGDLGKSWHDAGRMAAKTNTFGDFVACAEELIRRGETTPGRLAIAGGSAGGLLMGAVVNQRPELFGAVLSYVPFVDVISTMLDTTLPLTVGEFEEWGNPAVEEQYRWMIAYSPYENLGPKRYPPMLVRTSFWDSQVMYWEPAKYVARLREVALSGSGPVLLKTNLDAGGHGGFAGRFDKLRDLAFDYAFLLTQLP